MTQEIDLPPLPDLDCNMDKHAWEELMGSLARCHNAFVCRYGVGGDTPLWTEASMRQYAMQAVMLEREKCAKLCDRESDGWLYGDGARAADACAAAIRQSK